MICRKIAASEISGVLCEYLKQTDTVFVFSSDIACDTWSDRAVRNSADTGVSAVALERFIAWDNFKSAYLYASSAGKTAVPSIVRKLFVTSLIEENARKAATGSPLFKCIISPDYADSAVSFTDWISKLLPFLKLWRERYVSFIPQPDFDLENLDYLLLYERYSSFLEENNLFEQSWITPVLQETQTKFIIFYPEILEDFHEYKDILENAENVIIVSLPEEENLPSVVKYADARSELRYTILKILSLIESNQAEWTDIALSVPDVQTYRPYLERELKNYCVPFIIRAGIALTSNGAGAIFKQIRDCYSSDFSFESMRILLQNEYVPWKNDGSDKNSGNDTLNFRVLKENLIRLGSQMRCLCPYYDDNGRKIDVWEKSLKSNLENELELRFYRALKEDITRLCEAATFEGVRTAWFEFKEHYLAENEFSSESDKIISRCITELSVISEAYEKYSSDSITISSPFDFFLRDISAKTYRLQEQINGISIFPYRLAAQAHFPFHFIIDSSQKNLDVKYNVFDFLSRAKREELRIDSTMEAGDVSKLFVRLYSSVSGGNTYFSYSEQSFAGFAVAHNALKIDTDDSDKKHSALDKTDFIKTEQNWFLFGTTELERLTQRQKSAFEKWINTLNPKADSSYLSNCALELIHHFLYENRAPKHTDAPVKMTITQSDMKNFFPCARKWIFQNVLRLKEDSLDTDLMSPFDMGNINHAVLERFMRPYLESKKNLPCVNDDGIFDNDAEIQMRLEAIVKETIALPEMDFSKSVLAKEMLLSQIRTITSVVLDFLHFMLKKREDGGFGGTKVDSLEEWFSAAAENCLYNYLGRIDCVLSGGNIEKFIIDYKNSSASIPALSSCIADDEGRISDFQIPLYTVLLNAQKQSETAKALFLSIKDKTVSTVIDSEKKDNRSRSQTPEDYAETIKAFSEYAKRFYEKVGANDFLPHRNEKDIFCNVRPFEDCNTCGYASICRTVYKVAGENLGKD